MQTIFSIIIAFIISIGIFFVAIFIYQYSIQDGELIQIDKTSLLEKDFYTQNFEGKKIFIFGSSMVSAINATHVQKNLLENDHKYEVYNLAIASDKPIKRLKTIDRVIESKPDIIVYGIGFRDIQDKVSDGELKSESEFPNPKQFFRELLWNIEMDSKFNFEFLSSTRTVSFGVIDNIIREGNINPRFNKELDVQHIFKNTPFFPYYKHDTVVVNENIIKADIEELPSYLVNSPQKNKNVIALKKSIEILQEKNIEILIFTTPIHRLSFESLNYDENVLKTIMNNISQDTNVEINFLHNEYNQSHIWRTHDHLVVNNNTLFYSEDISNIILKKLNE
tara:strand:+ start:87 stop:1094 length:1008 start_codon:yes stop_codon:yes gene_type:complete